MWQTAWGQRDEDHECGITAHGYDDDNDTVQGDAVNVNGPSSVCVFNALALTHFPLSCPFTEECARILHGIELLEVHGRLLGGQS
jgi:hypothetical protein